MSGSSREEESCIVVRCSDTKEELSKRFVGISSMREDIKNFNSLLARHEIMVDGVEISTYYRRIFSDNLKSAGRVYSCGPFQSLPSKLRPKITLDGEETCEVDIARIHPSLLAVQLGKKLG